jgi:hypothetical protein
MATDRTVYHVVPDASGEQWVVSRENDRSFREQHRTKEEAVNAALGRRDRSACGGHLLAATVRPTLEVIVTETPGSLRRRLDADTGLVAVSVAAWCRTHAQQWHVDMSACR